MSETMCDFCLDYCGHTCPEWRTLQEEELDARDLERDDET
jgi:hypothetical protein